jgi:hypothetical protein
MLALMLERCADQWLVMSDLDSRCSFLAAGERREAGRLLDAAGGGEVLLIDIPRRVRRKRDQPELVEDSR